MTDLKEIENDRECRQRRYEEKEQRNGSEVNCDGEMPVQNRIVQGDGADKDGHFQDRNGTDGERIPD